MQFAVPNGNLTLLKLFLLKNPMEIYKKNYYTNIYTWIHWIIGYRILYLSQF